MNVIPETCLVCLINISTFVTNGHVLINQKVTDYIFLSCNGVILDTNQGVKYTSVLCIHEPNKVFLVPDTYRTNSKIR